MSNELDKALEILHDASTQDSPSTKKLAIAMAGLKDIDWDKVTEFKVTWDTQRESDGDIAAMLPEITLKKEPTY